MIFKLQGMIIFVYKSQKFIFDFLEYFKHFNGILSINFVNNT